MTPAALSPSSSSAPDTPDERVLTLGDDDVGPVADALASDTGRAVLTRLRREPAPASVVAAAVDESIQTVGYHLDRLAAAGLVTVIDTRYSPKGREMDVYASRAVTVVCEGAERAGD